MNETILHLFSGAGGSHLAGHLLGWQSVGSVEWQPYRRELCARRMPWSGPFFADVRDIQGRDFTGVHRIVGGFPCKGLSKANEGRRPGLSDPGSESALWFTFHAIIRDARPHEVFLENVDGIRYGGDLWIVVAGLEALGYRTEWLINHMTDVGAPSARPRWWALARMSNAPGYRTAPAWKGRAPAYHQWAGLTSNVGKNNGSPGEWRRNSKPLNVEAAIADGVPPPSPADLARRWKPGEYKHARAYLNPRWACRLMGWPARFFDRDDPRPLTDVELATLADPPWVAPKGHPCLPGEPPRIVPPESQDPEAIKALGDAWCPQQAAHAYWLLDRALG